MKQQDLKKHYEDLRVVLHYPYRYQLQVTDTPFASQAGLPDRWWRVVSTHRSIPGLYRAYRRELKARRPERNAWTGHVRIVRDDGRECGFDRDGMSNPPIYDLGFDTTESWL